MYKKKGNVYTSPGQEAIYTTKQVVCPNQVQSPGPVLSIKGQYRQILILDQKSKIFNSPKDIMLH